MSGDVRGNFKDRTFTGDRIALDGSSFINCSFARCTMLYSGGEIPTLSGCRFVECGWQFGGEAANTIGFLSGMYQGGFDKLIEATFGEIRRGAVISQTAVPEAGDETGLPGLLKPLRIFRIPKQSS